MPCIILSNVVNKFYCNNTHKIWSYNECNSKFIYRSTILKTPLGFYRYLKQYHHWEPSSFDEVELYQINSKDVFLYTDELPVVT